MTLSDYSAAFKSNLSDPVPVYVGQMDSHLYDFLSYVPPDGFLRALNLLHYGFSNFRSAILLTQGGAITAVPSVLRNTLEASAYGFLFHHDKEWWTHWQNRETDEASKNKFRYNGLKRVKSALKGESDTLFKQFDTLYETLISFGAHPNIFGVDDIVSYKPMENDRVCVSFNHLAGEVERERAYLMIGQTGVFFGNILTALWRKEAVVVDLSNKLIELSNRIETRAFELSEKGKIDQGD